MYPNNRLSGLKQGLCLLYCVGVRCWECACLWVCVVCYVAWDWLWIMWKDSCCVYEFVERVNMKFYVCSLVGMLIKWLQNAQCNDKETRMCLGTGVSFSVDLTEQTYKSNMLIKVLTALTGVITTLKFWNTQSWEASIYSDVLLKLCDSGPLKVQAHSNLYFVCTMYTKICFDLCDPKGISSKWGMWNVFITQPDTVNFICSICSNVFWIFVSCLWSDQSEYLAPFMIFNLWIGPGFIFESHS